MKFGPALSASAIVSASGAGGCSVRLGGRAGSTAKKKNRVSFTSMLHIEFFAVLLSGNTSRVVQPSIQSDLFENRARKGNRSDRILGSARIPGVAEGSTGCVS